MKLMRRPMSRWLLAASALWLVAAPAVIAQHTAKQDRPIELGTSGGSIEHLDFPFCCGGTLGALLQDGSGKQYILSNNHVIGRVNRAVPDEGIVQPGLIDVGCAKLPADIVGYFTEYVPISFNSNNLVDAAIAEVRPQGTNPVPFVDPEGSILEIGPLSSEIVAPFVGQMVKKSGRTTGLNFGEVLAEDVTATIKYSSQCGRSGGSDATFVHQFRTSKLAEGGDSGSVVVEDALSTPRAVGLLFAGSSTTTIVSPMDFVLDAFSFHLAMVGGTPPDPTFGTITGTVTDTDGLGISGATVSVEGTELSATTDGDGGYSLAGVPTGNQTVTASKERYQTQSKSLNVVEETNTLDFALQPEDSGGGGSEVWVQCINYETSGGRNQDRHLTVALEVRNNAGAVSGATVTATISPLGTFSTTTNSNGLAVFSFNNAAPDQCYSVTEVSVNSTSVDFPDPNGLYKVSGSKQLDSDCLDNTPTGCDGPPSTFTRSLPTQVPNTARMASAIGVKRRYEAALMRMPNVVGVGVGALRGNPVIEVYLTDVAAAAAAALPARLENVAVRPVITGEFVALPACSACTSCAP